MKHVLLALLIGTAFVPAARAEAPLPPAETVAEKGDRRDAEDASASPSTEIERRRARLDLMFGRLAEAKNERRAARIARHIMRRMTESGSDTIDLLMQRAAVAMRAEKYGLALDYLDGVVRLEPEFAEGWNRRATVYFLMGDYSHSLADLEQTLRLEPRHWGALAGLSMILVAVEKKAEAVAVMEQALKVHPFLEEMKERKERLENEIAGADI